MKADLLIQRKIEQDLEMERNSLFLPPTNLKKPAVVHVTYLATNLF